MSPATSEYCAKPGYSFLNSSSLKIFAAAAIFNVIIDGLPTASDKASKAPYFDVNQLTLSLKTLLTCL